MVTQANAPCSSRAEWPQRPPRSRQPIRAVGIARQVRAVRAPLQAPRFEVDPMWPKPLPNHWVLGAAVGVAVDSRDHVYVVNLTDSFSPRTEIGSGTNPPTGDCCTPAPNVLEFDPAGNLVGRWGGKGDGYEWPVENAGIAVDAKGNVWLGGGGNTDRGLLELTRTGALVKLFGQAPMDVAVHIAVDTAYASAARGDNGRAAGRGGAGGADVPGAHRRRAVVARRMQRRSRRADRRRTARAPTRSAAPSASRSTPKANEGFVADGCRNHRVAVIDLDDRRDQARLGRVRQGAGRRGGDRVPRRRHAVAVQPGHLRRAVERRPRLRLRPRQRPRAGLPRERHVRQGEVARADDARRRLGVGRRRSRATRRRSISTSPTE